MNEEIKGLFKLLGGHLSAGTEEAAEIIKKGAEDALSAAELASEPLSHFKKDVLDTLNSGTRRIGVSYAFAKDSLGKVAETVAGSVRETGADLFDTIDSTAILAGGVVNDLAGIARDKVEPVVKPVLDSGAAKLDAAMGKIDEAVTLGAGKVSEAVGAVRSKLGVKNTSNPAPAA